MSRLMSVALTEDAVRARRKTVTRRLNWWENKRGHRILRVGDKLTLCPKVQGRRVGGIVEPLDRIVEVTVTSIRREHLDAITADDILREGFELPGSPAASVAWFVEFFCDEMGCTPDTIVTRIEWAYPTPTIADLYRMMSAAAAGPDRHYRKFWQIAPKVWNDILAQHATNFTQVPGPSLPPMLYGLPVYFDPDAPGGIQATSLRQYPTPDTLTAQHAAAVAAALPYPEETP